MKVKQSSNRISNETKDKRGIVRSNKRKQEEEKQKQREERAERFSYRNKQRDFDEKASIVKVKMVEALAEKYGFDVQEALVHVKVYRRGFCFEALAEKYGFDIYEATTYVAQQPFFNGARFGLCLVRTRRGVWSRQTLARWTCLLWAALIRNSYRPAPRSLAPVRCPTLGSSAHLLMRNPTDQAAADRTSRSRRRRRPRSRPRSRPRRRERRRERGRRRNNREMRVKRPIPCSQNTT